MHACLYVLKSRIKKGFIITNETDTVYGKLLLDSNSKNAQKCVFVPQGTSDTKTFLPGEILGYRFQEDGKFYVTHQIPYKNTTRVVFLEYLLQGTLSLYCFYEWERTHFYIEDAEGTFWELEYDGDASIAPRRERYKGQLSYLMQDAPKTLSNVSNTQFERLELQDVLQMYHEEVCTTGEKCVRFELKDKGKIEVVGYVQAGAQHTFLTSQSSWVHLAMPSLTIGFDLRSLRISRSFSFFADFTANYLHTERDPNFWTLMLTPQVGCRYRYPNGKVRPFVGLGFEKPFYLTKGDSYSFTQTEENTAVPVVNKSRISYLENLSNLLLVGLNAGVDWMLTDRQAVYFQIDLRVAPPFSMLVDKYFTFYQRSGLSIGYRF